MMRFEIQSRTALAALCLAASCMAIGGGCASIAPSKPPVVASDTGAAATATADESTTKDTKDTKTADAAKKKPSVSEDRQKRLKEVAAEFDRCRDEAQYQAALNRWRSDDAAGCRECLNQLLERNPNHCPARLLLAEVALTEGKAKEALAQARQVAGLDPASAAAHHAMALSLDALGEAPAALEHYEKAARLEPQNEQYQTCYQAALNGTVPPPPSGPPDHDGSPGGSTDRLAAAVAALRDNRPLEAQRQAEAGLRLDPNSAVLYRVLGAASLGRGDFSAAQTALAQALALDNRDPLTYFLMGSTLVQLGDPDGARRSFAEAARLDPRYAQPRQ